MLFLVVILGNQEKKKLLVWYCKRPNHISFTDENEDKK